MKELTLLESAIERKNHYQGRMAENLSNIIYFGKRKASLEEIRNGVEVDSEERAALNVEIAQADKAIDSGHDNVIQDELLNESFKELIVDLKSDTVKAKKVKS